MSRIALILVLLCLVLVGCDEDPEVKVKLRGADESVAVHRDDAGNLTFHLTTEGQTETLDPQAFAHRVYYEQSNRPWYLRVLNVTSVSGITWVALGLLGQLLFTGRMLVQWIASEKHKRSVVPTAFWWLALSGATLLLIYFLWRKDIIGVLGQSTGWAIYVRNLYFIHRPRTTDLGDPPDSLPHHEEPADESQTDH